MPVEKFRNSEDARSAHRSEPGSAENIRRMKFVLDFWSRLRPKHCTPGVFKYRSIQDADEGDSRRREGDRRDHSSR